MTRSVLRQTRRHFLKSGAAIGLAGAAPLLLTSCGGSDDDDPAPAPPQGAREARNLQFDLSAAAVANPRLFALRSVHHDAPLLEHTTESRAKHRALNAALAEVPDDKLTHYLENVDLPAGSLQSVLVFGTNASTGAPELLGAYIHVPMAAQATVAARNAAKQTRRERSAKAAAYGIPSEKVLADGLNEGANSLVSPFDTAVFLAFHHPEVMNLKPDLGADILNRIETSPCAPGDDTCSPFVDTLAFKIETLNRVQGYPTTTPGGWATLLPLTDTSGKPALDDKGQPIYRYDIADDIAAATGAVVRDILKNVYDDPLFEGINWHATEGIASQPVQTPVAAAVAEAFSVQAEHPVGATLAGMRIVGLEVVDAGTRTVRMAVKNDYLRFLSVYVQYLDANEKPLPVENPGEQDTTRSKFIRMVSTNEEIMGIPFQGGSVETTNVEFALPTNASHAKLMFGSLGLGGDAFTPEAVVGSCLTLGLNIGVPTLLLAWGAYADLKEGWDSIFKTGPLLSKIVQQCLAGLKNAGVDVVEGIYSSANSQSAIPFLATLGNIAVQAVLAAAPEILAEILIRVGTQSALAAVPIVGIACKLLAVGAELAVIAVSVGEVLASPAIATNRVSLTMDTKVTIKKDPRDFQFPASATKYTVELFYDGGAVPRTKEGTLTAGTTTPIEVTFAGMPSGGKVVAKVSLHSADGCLVGVKQSGSMANLPASAGDIELEIVELVAPLKADTQYVHTLKLGYESGARKWSSTAPAPQLTRANLCAGADNAICDLNGLTVHTASGMAGYGFNAGGQGVNECGKTTGGSLNTIQNEYLGETPDQAYKFSSCSYAQPVGIVYDPLGPAVGGHHFFLLPVGDSFHLKSITLDNTTAFNFTEPKSWGQFSSALDSLAVLPSGYLVGVNRSTHKMEVLLLPSEPVDGALEPQAVVFASMKAGLGTRAGLLDTPVAVATSRGAILVLEQGNKRVQALDPSGNAVKLFKGATTNLMPLQAETGASYLDLAVEGLGYMYVLSYIGDGPLPADYRLDIYTPDGAFLTRTSGVAAARLAVDLFRTVYTLNYETVVGAPKVEPSLSQWLPSNKGACPTTLPAVASVQQSVASCAAPMLSAV